MQVRRMTSRRDLLRSAAGLLPFALGGTKLRLHRLQRVATRVVVVGAGAFGGWTALHLARRGASVTLIDAWGAGNARASSGGETRVIRAVYNGQRVYIEMVRRAFELWREHERAWQRAVLHRTGALWMFEKDDDSFARSSVELVRAVGLTLDELSPADAEKRFPQISFDGVRRVWWESDAGFLLARESCELVRQECVRRGVEYVTAQALPVVRQGEQVSNVSLGDGTRREGDVFVFACGPWLGALFPDVIGRRVRPTKQDVLYFGTAPGDREYDIGQMPVWVNFGERLIYGVPGNERRGFKIADDSLGADVDPTTFERVIDTQSVAQARALMARRFPRLGRAPLVHSEVCQYESTPDGHFLIDWHPHARNVLLVGGGSGHGFKMGPAIGEIAAHMITDGRATEPMFAYGRLRDRG